MGKAKIRLGEEKDNHQGCKMKIVEYNNSHNVVVEFQDEYGFKANTTYQNFIKGEIKNPYFPDVFGVAMIGSKYPSRINGVKTKEYKTWISMFQRCYDDAVKTRHPTYKSAICCNEWLVYENFYEWLHRQENFEKWINGDKWCIDKDILVKRNKVYSPETCCLVPNSVNVLFTKRDNFRGDLPIGVCKYKDKFRAQCQNPFSGEKEYLGLYETPKQAFKTYKTYKEDLIKKVAEDEYFRDNISEHCYIAMMSYIVEIDD